MQLTGSRECTQTEDDQDGSRGFPQSTLTPQEVRSVEKKEQGCPKRKLGAEFHQL